MRRSVMKPVRHDGYWQLHWCLMVFRARSRPPDRHGSPDAARLGVSLQRRRRRRPGITQAAGSAPKLTKEQWQELGRLIIEGPDRKAHKVIRWRCIDLCAEMQRRFSVTVYERTMGKWLHKLGLTRLQPRPVHPKKDPEAEAAFKKTLLSLVKTALLGTHGSRPGGNLVPGRSPRWSERRTRLYLGAGRFASA